MEQILIFFNIRDKFNCKSLFINLFYICSNLRVIDSNSTTLITFNSNFNYVLKMLTTIHDGKFEIGIICKYSDDSLLGYFSRFSNLEIMDDSTMHKTLDEFHITVNKLDEPFLS